MKPTTRRHQMLLAAIFSLVIPMAYLPSAFADVPVNQVKFCAYNENRQHTLSICYQFDGKWCSDCSQRVAIGFLNPSALQDGREFSVCKTTSAGAIVPADSKNSVISLKWGKKTGYLSVYSEQSTYTSKSEYDNCVKSCGSGCATDIK